MGLQVPVSYICLTKISLSILYHFIFAFSYYIPETYFQLRSYVPTMSGCIWICLKYTAKCCNTTSPVYQIQVQSVKFQQLLSVFIQSVQYINCIPKLDCKHQFRESVAILAPIRDWIKYSDTSTPARCSK